MNEKTMMKVPEGISILDACCGGRMFWFNKNNPHVLFADNREGEWELCDGRHFSVKPDIRMDFRDMPFEDNSFRMVVFDPPHITQIGDGSYMAKKYGSLPSNWEDYISGGFRECFRVLCPGGFLIFKWSEVDITVKTLLSVIKEEPLFGHKSGRLNKTHWMVFMKNRK